MRWVRSQRGLNDERDMRKRSRFTRGLARCPWCGRKPAKRDFTKNAGRIAWINCVKGGVYNGPGKPHHHWVIYQSEIVVDALKKSHGDRSFLPLLLLPAP